MANEVSDETVSYASLRPLTNSRQANDDVSFIVSLAPLGRIHRPTARWAEKRLDAALRRVTAAAAAAAARTAAPLRLHLRLWAPRTLTPGRLPVLEGIMAFTGGSH